MNKELRDYIATRDHLRETLVLPILRMIDAAGAVITNAHAERDKAVTMLEVLRPVWAQGYTSDSVAAQTTATAISQIWRALEVEDQSAAMVKLRALLDQSGEHASEAALTWLGQHEALELFHFRPVYGDDDDQATEWRVVEVAGSINDREREIVGRGESPFAAITAARSTLAGRPARA
jgi:hypothetical protein